MVKENINNSNSDKKELLQLRYLLANIEEYRECINTLNPITDMDLLNQEMALFAASMQGLSLDDQQICWPVIGDFQNKFQVIDNNEKASKKRYSL